MIEVPLKPYVQRVEVSQSPFYNSGSPFYIVEWEEYWQPTDWAGTGMLFITKHKTDRIQAASGQYLKIVTLTSEPMEELTLSIPALGADSASFIVQELENGTRWVFTTPIATPVEIAYYIRYVLYFRLPNHHQ